MKLLVAIILLFMVDYTHPKTADLTIVVKNITKVRGHIRLAIYNKEENWMTTGKEFRTVEQEVRATTVKIVVKDLPLGEYGISIYHDMNDNKELDKNWTGLPSEPYCFSNNVKPFMKKPDYEDAKFKISEKMTIYLQLIH